MMMWNTAEILLKPSLLQVVEEGEPYQLPVEHSGSFCYPAFLDPLTAHIICAAG